MRYDSHRPVANAGRFVPSDRIAVIGRAERKGDVMVIMFQILFALIASFVQAFLGDFLGGFLTQ